jgi:serine/threonine protein phosphatase PrpC
VVVAEPDITAFKITPENKFDFIIIGCDGIFDKLDNKETVHLVW